MEEITPTPTGGFMAIQPPVPKAPYARRVITRGEDGTAQVILVDMNGNRITDPTGYGIVESGNYLNESTMQAAPAPGQSNTQTTPERTADNVIKSTTKAEGGRDSNSQPGTGNFGRSPSNNFGYVNKPGVVGMAGALPGMLGLGGKAINAGINANNVAAVNAARGMMGLDGVGVGGAIKGTVKDNKGQVANVTFGTSQYATPVGLEALSPDGMTNMTPAEAAARARAVGSIQEATPEQVQARDEAFEAEFSKPGLLGRMSNVATSFLDNMFGTPNPSYYQPDAKKDAAIRSQNSGSNFNPTDDGFASMLGAKSAVSGASRSTAGKTGGGRADNSSSGGARPGSGGSEGASARSGGVF